MKFTTIASPLVLIGIGMAVAGDTPVASAQVYNWVPWASTGSQSAEATRAGLGTVTVSVSENGTNAVTPFPIRFDGVDFTPAEAPSVAVGNTPIQDWSATINFAAVPDTDGVIVGIGNFGHGTATLPGYRLEAFDVLGAPLPLTLLEQIGSYNHTWTDSGIPFNDDVTLLTASGIFAVTPVAGLNENNSDILLMSLPPGVGRLVVFSSAPTSGDTLNVLIATLTSSPPTVSDQPDDAAACAGGGIATFMVAAEGPATLSYQWRKNTVVLSNGVTGFGSTIAGATVPSLTISSVAVADAGDYDCVITNSGGSDTSAVASLTVFVSGGGDGNGDALVNGLDIAVLIAAILQGGAPSQAYCAYDMNGDGGVDVADVQLFVLAVLAD